MIEVRSTAHSFTVDHLTEKLKGLMNEFADTRMSLASSTRSMETMELYLTYEEARLSREQVQLEHDKEVVQQQKLELGNSRRMLSQKQTYLNEWESDLWKQKEDLRQQKIDLDEERAQWASQVHQLNSLKAQYFQRNQSMMKYEEKLGLMRLDIEKLKEKVDDEQSKIISERAELMKDRERFLKERSAFEHFMANCSNQMENADSQDTQTQGRSRGRGVTKESGEKSCLRRSDGIEHPALLATQHAEAGNLPQGGMGKRKIYLEDPPLNLVKRIKVETRDPHTHIFGIKPKPVVENVLNQQANELSSSQSDGSQLGGADEQPRLSTPEMAKDISPETRRKRKLMVETLDITHIELTDGDIKENSPPDSVARTGNQIIMTRGKTRQQSSRRTSEPWQDQIRNLLSKDLPLQEKD